MVGGLLAGKSIGEDVGKGFDEGTVLFTPAPPQLEAKQVDPAVQEPAVEGQFVLHLVGEATPLPEFAEIEFVEVGDELG